MFADKYHTGTRSSPFNGHVFTMSWFFGAKNDKVFPGIFAAERPMVWGWVGHRQARRCAIQTSLADVSLWMQISFKIWGSWKTGNIIKMWMAHKAPLCSFKHGLLRCILQPVALTEIYWILLDFGRIFLRSHDLAKVEAGTSWFPSNEAQATQATWKIYENL